MLCFRCNELRFVLVYCTIVNAVCALGEESAAQSSWQDDPLGAVLDAWESSASAKDAVECTWNERRVFLPGTAISPPMIKHLGLEQTYPDINAELGWPGEVLEVTTERRLRLKDALLYITDISIGPANKGAGAIVTDFISANNGKVSVRSSEQAQLYDKSTNSEAKSLSWLPLRFILRPLDQRFNGVVRKALEVIKTDEATGLITLGDGKGVELVVDAGKNFSVVAGKALSKETGKAEWDFEISYDTRQAGEFCPGGWNMNLWDSSTGELTTRYIASDFSWELNKPLSEDDFTVQIPKQIPVFDADGRRMTSIEAQSELSYEWTWLKFNIVLVNFAVLAWLGIRWLRRRSPKEE